MRLLGCLSLLVLGTVSACSAILGINEAVVDSLDVRDFPEGGRGNETGADGGDEGGGGVDAGLQCPANRANCNKLNEDGCEVDLTLPANCGSCGHVCLACSQGQCAPDDVVTGGGIDYAGFLAVDAANLYVASPGSKGVFVAPRGGGAATKKIANDPFDVTTLYVGPKYVGVTLFTTSLGIQAVDYATGTAVGGIATDTCAGGSGMLADETGAIYFAHTSSGVGNCDTPMRIVKRTPSGGGFLEEWAFEMGGFYDDESNWMAVDGQFLYFVGYRRNATTEGIYRISRAGGASSLVMLGHFNGTPLALDGQLLYAIENNDEAGLGPSQLISVDKTTGAKTVLATGEKSFVLGVATRASIQVDATHVYWTAADGPGLGRIMRVPKGGGAKEILAAKQPNAYGVAVDAAFVYWSTTSAIRRIPR